jgi:L-threonylcarbamoyladenylate synthase
MPENVFDQAELARAAALIRGGQLVAFPTETVYGLGADALNPEAVARIFEAKGRPRFDPLIVHVASLEQAREVAEFSPRELELASAFWPGPLTLVLPRRPSIPDIVTAGLDTVGVRMPAHPLALELIRAAGRPIAAPSANRFGCVSPTTADAVAEQLGGRVSLVLDGGPCVVGLESTVVLVLRDALEVLRPGAVTEAMLSERGFTVRRGLAVHERPLAPGLLKSHYSPGKPLRLLALGETPAPSPRHGLLAFRRGVSGFAACEVLSAQGSLTEAAANLFAAMRRLGASEVEAIVAESVPEEGIGAAIMDRLRRAASAEL